MSIVLPDITAKIARYRRRQLQFLSVLALGVSGTMVFLTIGWGMWEVAVPSFFYAPLCVFTMVMLRRRPEWLTGLANLFIVATMAVTQAGVFLQKPGAITDPWIMTCPVVAYGLCERKTAAGWTALTVLILFVLRPFQPYQSVTPGTTTILALATVAIATVCHLYSRYTEENERLIVELGNTDSLTGTLNRRTFMPTLETEFRRNLRQGTSMSAFMVDVDYFKTFNDHYGHLRGDETLAEVAQALTQTARRAGDYVFRYGGEEFCVLCSSLDQAHAAAFAEQLRASVAALKLPHAISPLGTISVSVGYRHAESLGPLTPTRLVEEADKALYQAKAMGRNRVEANVGGSAA